VIEITDLAVSYRHAPRNAVDGVSFTVPRGQLTALAGPNGSGKSSIVRALLRRADIVGGAVMVDERDVTTFSYAELARLVAVVHSAKKRRSRRVFVNTSRSGAIRTSACGGRLPRTTLAQ